MKIIHINYINSPMDCDLELFTFADNCFRGLKHIKHFCCHSVFGFGIRIGSVRHRPRDFQLLSGQKFCHYLGGDKGGIGGQGKR